MSDLKFNATIEDVHGKTDTDKDGTRLPYTILKLRAAVDPEQAMLLYEMLETGFVKVVLSEVQGRLPS